jgi:hypothetical protein
MAIKRIKAHGGNLSPYQKKRGAVTAYSTNRQARRLHVKQLMAEVKTEREKTNG